jgi:hypothetical protein
MQYQDPLQVTCPSCGVEGTHRVRTLLELRARCAVCDAALDLVGREMRQHLAEWATFVGKVEVAMDLESTFKISLSDPELEAAQRGMDLVAIIRAKLSPLAPDGLAVAEIVRAAIARARRLETSPDQLATPFPDLFDHWASGG